MSQLTVKIDELNKGNALIVLTGFLDAQTFEYLESEIIQLLKQGNANLIADVSGLEHLSSAGVGVFINVQANMKDNGNKLVIANPTPKIREILELLGLMEVLPVADDLESAKKMLGM